MQFQNVARRLIARPRENGPLLAVTPNGSRFPDNWVAIQERIYRVGRDWYWSSGLNEIDAGPHSFQLMGIQKDIVIFRFGPRFCSDERLIPHIRIISARHIYNF